MHFHTLQHTQHTLRLLRAELKGDILNATQCLTLQHTATHCNTLKMPWVELKVDVLTATQCNALQHTATHCNTLQHTLRMLRADLEVKIFTAIYYNTFQCNNTAIEPCNATIQHCNTIPQHNTVLQHCNTL